MLRSVARFVFAAVLCCSVHGAFAQSNPNTAWVCWYGGETLVYCLLQSAGPPQEAAVPAVAPGVRPLPVTVQAIRNAPASLEDQTIAIPLHTVPYDMDFVRQLTESVMCGGNSACAVAFGRSYAEATGLTLANSDPRVL